MRRFAGMRESWPGHECIARLQLPACGMPEAMGRQRGTRAQSVRTCAATVSGVSNLQAVNNMAARIR